MNENKWRAKATNEPKKNYSKERNKHLKIYTIFHLAKVNDCRKRIANIHSHFGRSFILVSCTAHCFNPMFNGFVIVVEWLKNEKVNDIKNDWKRRRFRSGNMTSQWIFYILILLCFFSRIFLCLSSSRYYAIAVVYPVCTWAKRLSEQNISFIPASTNGRR